MSGSGLPSTPSASARVLASLGDLPTACGGWLAAAGPQSSRAWLDATLEAALPEGAVPRFVLVEEAGKPLAVLPLLSGLGGAWQSLTTPYTCLYRIVGDPALDEAGWRSAGRAAAALLRRHGPVRLEALDPDAVGFAAFLSGLRASGVLSLPYAHFGNWHEPVAGLGWQGYLASRQGTLRETIRRRLRAAERDAAVTMHVAVTPGEVAAGLDAYEAVYARSWKVPEPFPRFNAALLPRLAAEGWLRLAVLWCDGEPVAAQYWTVWQGVATVLKLAHDERRKAMSPGTVLTASMVRRLLDEEGVAELDFGRGDDAYKGGWATRRRQRIGVVLADPLRPAGLASVVRYTAGHMARRRFVTGLQPFRADVTITTQP
jgi:hypothetical protein